MARELPPFSKLKRRIRQEFPQIKLIGDIAISDEEYRLLVKYVKDVNERMVRGTASIQVDPVLAVALVQIGIRHYDSDYWSKVAAEIGKPNIPTNQQTKFRLSFQKTLQHFELACLKDGGRISNILMHGFVSNHYAPDLFNFLFAFYDLDLERDLSRLNRQLMDELIAIIIKNDNTGRTYLLVQQTADAVAVLGGEAKIRIGRLLRLIDRCFWDQLQLTPESSVNRLVRQFAIWQTSSDTFASKVRQYHSGSNAGTRKRSFSSPYLHYRFNDRSFCVTLPTQLIPASITSDIYWTLSYGDERHCVPVKLYAEGVTGNKTEEKSFILPAERIFTDLHFALMSNNTQLRRFQIIADSIRFFDRKGNFISPALVTAGEVLAFTHPDEIPISDAYSASERVGNLLLTYFHFQDGDILRLPNGNPLVIGKQLVEGILPRGRVAGAYVVNATGEQIPVYNKPPTILIKIKASRAPGTVISVNQRRSRLFDNDTTHFAWPDGGGEFGYLVNLGTYGYTDDGTYQVLVDVPNDQTRRYWRFALISNFEFQFEDAPYVFVPRGTIRFHDEVKVTPDKHCVAIKNENAFKFHIDAQTDFIMLAIATATTELPLRIYVPVLKWKFDQGEWQIGQPPKLWHSELPNFIYVKYPDDQPTLSLDEGGSKYLARQSARFTKVKSEHLFKCEMTRFKSWLGRAQAKRQVYLDLPNRRQEFFQIVTRSIVDSCLIQADYDRSLLVGELEIMGKSDYYVDIQYDNELLSEKLPLKNGKFELPCSLANGQYCISIFEAEANDTGFGEITFLPIGKFNQQLLNPHDLQGQDLMLNHVKNNEEDVFRLNFSCTYIVRNLEKDTDMIGNIYNGNLYALGRFGQELTSMPVRVEFHDLNKLSQARISVLYYDEYYEFLYDEKERILVAEEQPNLPKAECYRRYTPLYTDEYVYIVNFC